MAISNCVRAYSIPPLPLSLIHIFRLVLISVTEGEDKPLKYPTIFNSADVSIVTKLDLTAAVEFSWQTAYNNIQAVRPGMPVFKLSAKTGEGMEKYLEFLATRLSELRPGSVV